jgi:hypothetical protein
MVNAKTLMYGFDAPTGGFFWNLINNSNEELSGAEDGLTLTQLKDSMMGNFSIEISSNEMIEDFTKAEPPSVLQINVGKMFGKDIISMLNKVGEDIDTNYLFLQK